MLKMILLRYVARNIQSLVDFITSLDAAFDAFVVKQEAKITTLDGHIAALNDAKAKLVRDTNIANSLKAALPDTKSL